MKRIGKVEKEIIEILNYFKDGTSYKDVDTNIKIEGSVEISIRRLAVKIFEENNTNSSKHNTIRNTVNRLEKYKIIQTKVASVYNRNIDYIELKNGIPSKLRMVRLWAEDIP
jgi:hypothetical protein